MQNQLVFCFMCGNKGLTAHWDLAATSEHLNGNESLKSREAETSKVKHRLGIQASPAQYLQCYEQVGKALHESDLSMTTGAQEQFW